jgi:MoaA/NifB/PqqE/SkfB family radical SAM enzyme
MSLVAAAMRSPAFLGDVWRRRMGRSVLPRMLTYTVTFRCNARCIMCDSWKMKGEGDLQLPEIESIFRQLPKMDAVRLTGGEPFARPDLLEIVELTIRHLKPLGLHITTNGFLTDRIVDLCEQRTRTIPLQVMVSLDGLKEHHNYVRGSSIAWSTATKTLELLADQRKAWNLDLVVNQTIVDADGLEHYRQLKDFLKPLGIRHQTVVAYDTSATYNLEKEIDVAPKQVGQFTTFGVFKEEDLRLLFDEINEDLDSLPWWARRAKQYYLAGIRERLLSSERSEDWTNPPCAALHSHLRIFPNGDIPTCQFNSQTIGNLRKNSFAEIWESQFANEQKEWVKNCVGCWAECEILPSAVYSLDLLLPKNKRKATNVVAHEVPAVLQGQAGA